MGIRSRRASAQIARAISAVLRTIPICAPVTLAPVAALAQPASAVLVADIPAQPLTRALAAFADQTGLQLIYVSGVASNRNSHAAKAGLGAAEALTRMLKGTGLKFEYLTPYSIRILGSGAASEVATQ